MALFREFHKRELPLHILDFGTIILLQKYIKAKQIQQCRPIYLLNVSFKIFTKVATKRIVKFVQRIIKTSQIAFLPGQNIIEGAVILHDATHELHQRNKMTLFLRLILRKIMIRQIRIFYNKP
jgi:hypothetical protein